MVDETATVRLEVLCFAGTYGLALLSDLARFAVRSKARWYATLGLTALGWVVQTFYLGDLAWRGHRPPITTVFESLLTVAWVLAAIDLYLIAHAPKTTAVGLFVMPVVVGIVAVAGLWAPRDDWSGWGGDWVRFWGMFHGVLLLAGAVSTCVAFAAGLMYLAQARRLKHKRPPRFGLALPSLEQSERLNRGAIMVAFPLLTFGLLIGVALVLTQPGHLRWNDPKVLSAGAMWLAFAALLHARFRPAMRGRRVVALTVVAFAFMVFTWIGVDLLGLPTAHGGRPSP